MPRGRSVNPVPALTATHGRRAMRGWCRGRSSVRECCDRNPDPACTTLRFLTTSVSTKTLAPIASRLLVVPVKRIVSPARGGILVAEDAQLWRLAGGHDGEVRIAIAIQIEHRERSAVLIEIEPRGAGDVVEAARPSLRRSTLRCRFAIEPCTSNWFIARHASSYGVPFMRVSGDRATT